MQKASIKNQQQSHAFFQILSFLENMMFTIFAQSTNSAF